jgi:hypothetical protein
MRSRVLMIDVGITAHSVMLLPTRHPCTIMSVSGHLGCSCTAFLIHHRQPLHLILHLYQYLTDPLVEALQRLALPRTSVDRDSKLCTIQHGSFSRQQQ